MLRNIYSILIITLTLCVAQVWAKTMYMGLTPLKSPSVAGHLHGISFGYTKFKYPQILHY